MDMAPSVSVMTPHDSWLMSMTSPLNAPAMTTRRLPSLLSSSQFVTGRVDAGRSVCGAASTARACAAPERSTSDRPRLNPQCRAPETNGRADDCADDKADAGAAAELA